MDRYGLAREFELRKFEMHDHAEQPIYITLQEIAIKIV